MMAYARRTHVKSSMHTQFNQAYALSDCDWITYCGGWMLYDGALFVERPGH